MAQQRLYNPIEYLAGTENRYLLMDEVAGKTRSMAHLEPDSPAWFAWLAHLGSFHFTGRQERKQLGEAYWYAYRKAHAQRFKRYLGTTDKLTLVCSEQTARNLHEATLGAIPDDEALHTRSPKPMPEGLQVGPLTLLTSSASFDREPSPDMPVSRLPQRRDRVPFRCGPGFTHHPALRPRRRMCMGRLGALVLALT